MFSDLPSVGIHRILVRLGRGPEFHKCGKDEVQDVPQDLVHKDVGTAIPHRPDSSCGRGSLSDEEGEANELVVEVVWQKF